MEKKYKCDKCGQRTKSSDLILVETNPEILHYCRKCCDEEGIYVSPIYGIAGDLV